MKYAFLSLLFCILASSVFSQNSSFDHIISKNAVIRCEDVQFNAYTIIKGLYERKQIDSIYRFIDYWESKCGVRELSFRTRQLFNIEQGRFSPERITAEWIEFLVAYKETSNNGLSTPLTAEGVDINRQLDYLNTFLYNYARSIPTQTYSLDAKLMLEFYSSKHPTFDEIANASPEESRLSEFYHNEWERTEHVAVWDILFNAGYYRPFWKMERFGGHPILGLGYGYSVNRHTTILQLDFYAGPSRDDYTVVYNGALITQRKWTGMYVGLEYYYQIIKKDMFSFGLSPGIGYDGITVIPSENQYGEESKALRSFNGSIGFQGRYRYDEQHSIGLSIRINRASFNNPGGTELNGGYVTFKVFWSFMDDVRTSTRRRLLK